MKKIVYFLLFALCLPIGLMAQSVDDDLYFIPSKDKQEKKETPVKKETKKQVTNIYTSPGTTVVVQDRKGRTRDVDEYNRRYDARENEFVMDNDTDSKTRIAETDDTFSVFIVVCCTIEFARHPFSIQIRIRFFFYI